MYGWRASDDLLDILRRNPAGITARRIRDRFESDYGLRYEVESIRTMVYYARRKGATIAMVPKGSNEMAYRLVS